MRSSNPVQVFRLVYGVILFQTLVYQMKWGSFASWVSTKPVSSSRNNLLDIPHLPQTFTIAYKIWRELKNNIDDYRLKVGPDWARELKFGGWAGGWAERIQVSAGQLSDLYKIMILLRKSVVAGAGFEPATFGLWARWATWLLHPAMCCQKYKTSLPYLLKKKAGARDGSRTRDFQLGRLTLYQLSYSRGIKIIIS